MAVARNQAAGGAKRGGKTAVPKLRAAAQHVIELVAQDGERFLSPELMGAIGAMSDALSAEKAASAGYTPEPFDWYCEEVWVTDLLLEAEAFEGEIVDPACGRGAILASAMAAGFKVRGFDLVDRMEFRLADFPFEQWSFFDERHPVGECDNIICNPPYSYQKGIAEVFIRHALTVARRKVAMLLPVKFNSSNGRHLLFTGTPLARVYTLSSRPSMPPGSLLVAGKIKPEGGKVDYAWFVWDRGHVGPSQNLYLIRPDKQAAQLKKQAKKEGRVNG